MDQTTVELLSRLHAEGREFDGTQPDRLNRRRNLEPESAAVLHSLIEGLKPAHLLELGTSNGYSTIWLADAVSPATALTTVDNDPGRAGEATKNIAAAGFSDRITQVTGDGFDVLHAAADQSWEFIFLDAERSLYVQWWPELQRTLTDGGLLVVDNVLSHADQVAEFRALVDATAGFRSLVVPIGAGLLVIARQD